MINFIWKIYKKLSNYDQKIKEEFEYELVKKYEEKFYTLWKITEANSAENLRQPDAWLKGYDAGRKAVYKNMWNDLYDRYYRIAKKLNRIDEFSALRKSRARSKSEK